MPHLERLRNEMKKRGEEAVLVTDSVNERYLSGFPFDDGYLLITDTDALLLTDFRYEEAAKKNADPAFMVTVPEKGPFSAIPEVLREKGIRTLTVEEDTLPVGEFERLRAKCDGVSFHAGASKLIGGLQRAKTEAELGTIRRAQAVTDAAFSHILGYLRPGLTERDAALELEFFMRKAGAEETAFSTIAVSGSASALPHGVPRDRVLETGFLTMDFGAKVDGYCSDMTRTVVIGRADEEIRRVYETVLDAQKAALEAAAAGERSCKKLDAIARERIDKAGYGGTFGHSLGHGVGVRIHEEPRLSPRVGEEQILLPGDVVTFEPGIYLAGRYGCRIEDMGTILPDGSFLDLTNSPKELTEIL